MSDIKKEISLPNGLPPFLPNTSLRLIWVVINIQCVWPTSWLHQKQNLLMLSQISLSQERMNNSLAIYMSLRVVLMSTNSLSKLLVGFRRAMVERRHIIAFMAGLFFRLPPLILSVLNLKFCWEKGRQWLEKHRLNTVSGTFWHNGQAVSLWKLRIYSG